MSKKGIDIRPIIFKLMLGWALEAWLVFPERKLKTYQISSLLRFNVHVFDIELVFRECVHSCAVNYNLITFLSTAK